MRLYKSLCIRMHPLCIQMYPYESVCILMRPAVSQYIHMHLYKSQCIRMHPYVSKCILEYPYASLRIRRHPYESACILMNSHASLWICIHYHVSLCILIYLYVFVNNFRVQNPCASTSCILALYDFTSSSPITCDAGHIFLFFQKKFYIYLSSYAQQGSSDALQSINLSQMSINGKKTSLSSGINIVYLKYDDGIRAFFI